MDKSKKSLKYIFVEDDDNDIFLMEKAIVNLSKKKSVHIDYEVIKSTHNLNERIENFEDYVFVFDLSLGGETPYEFLSTNRAGLKTSYCFVLTSSDNKKTIEKYHDLNIVNEFLFKPYYIHDLEQVIYRILDIVNTGEKRKSHQ